MGYDLPDGGQLDIVKDDDPADGQHTIHVKEID